MEQEVVAGKYRLLRPLSEGGMGTLWLAHNEALDIECALKVIRADIGEVERAQCEGRLLQEARAAAKLGHPAIVRVTDVGQTERGEPFLVMELLKGEDLGAVVTRRGQVAPTTTVQFMLPIIHALSCAHEKGIVHRDVKPENIFLARNQDGSIQPKLIDFGIAKLQRAEPGRLTVVGAIVGTPGYMSPEQARGRDSDARADIWAICVILYELFTGSQPFRGDNYNALMRAIIEEEPPLMSSYGVTDKELSAIVERGMTKEPIHRWPTMRELGVALADWLLGKGYDSDVCGTSLHVQWLMERESLSLGDGFDAVPAARWSTPRNNLRETPVSSVSGRRIVFSSSPPDSKPISTPPGDDRPFVWPSLPGVGAPPPSSRSPATAAGPSSGPVPESGPAPPSGPAPTSSPSLVLGHAPTQRGSDPAAPSQRPSSVQPMSTPTEAAPASRQLVPQVARRRPRRTWIVGASAGAVVLGIVGLMALSGGKPATGTTTGSAAAAATGAATHTATVAPQTRAPESSAAADASSTPIVSASAPPGSASSASAAPKGTASVTSPPPRTTTTAAPPRTTTGAAPPPPPPPPATTPESTGGALKKPTW